MSFISYAQNFEDVMLWRALNHVEDGFYIDVGANDPDELSVTKAFYDANWHGINIEPVREYFDLLQTARPRDINLCLGAGAVEGTLELFNIPESGLATSDPAIARSHREAGWHVEPQQMNVRTLAQICEEHVKGPIHFLKIDVEGAELDVISGMDFQRWRPWIVVVEATVPLSQKQVHEEWEGLLLAERYEPIYFDGLNRYYLAQEHAELKTAFDAPPNPFDHYISSDTHEARIKHAEAQSRLEQALELEQSQQARQEELQTELQQAETVQTSLVQRVQQLEKNEQLLEQNTRQLEQELTRLQRESAEELARARDRTTQAEHRVHELMSSSSWRLTGPMRRLARLAKKMVPRAAHTHPAPAPHPAAGAPEAPESSRTSQQTNLKTAFKSALRRSIKTTLSTRPVRAIIANPSVRGRVTSVLYRYPALDARVRSLVHQARAETVPAHLSRPSTPVATDDNAFGTLPRSARRVLLAIQRSSKTPD